MGEEVEGVDVVEERGGLGGFLFLGEGKLVNLVLGCWLLKLSWVWGERLRCSYWYDMFLVQLNRSINAGLCR